MQKLPKLPKLPAGRWLAGFGLLLLLLALFAWSGIFTGRVRGDGRPSWEATLFFCLLIAYIVPVFHFISERTVKALQALKPWLTASPDAIAGWEARLARKPKAGIAWALAGGLLAGAAHNLLLYGSLRIQPFTSSGPAETAFTLGVLLVWTVMALVISALTDNALLFARAARTAQVEPLHSQRLRPFADAATYPTLAIIGALALFPILLLDSDASPLSFLPGLAATGLPLLALAGLPLWPVHRRMADAKRQALAAVETQISALPRPNPTNPETLATLAPLLTYRRELQAAQEWPFDLGALARLLLYLIIPPLTWVGAALIENLVEAFL